MSKYMWLYRWEKIRTNVGLWIAHRLPRWLKYWVVIDVTAHYTTQVEPNAIIPEVTWDDLVRSLER